MAIKEIAKPYSDHTFIHPPKPVKKRPAGAIRDFLPTDSSTVTASKSEALGPCKSDLGSFKSVETVIETETQSPNLSVYQTHPKSLNSRLLRVSDEQRLRIIDRYNNAGASIRKIAREEGRARQTVTRIVRSADTRKYDREIERMRQEFRSLVPLAFKSLLRAMKNDTTGMVASRYLEQVGVIPKGRKK